MTTSQHDYYGEGEDIDIDLLRRSRAGSLPVDWDEWTLDEKADWLTRRNKRIKLMEMLLAAHGIVPEYQSDGSKEILTTEELAKMYIETVGVK